MVIASWGAGGGRGLVSSDGVRFRLGGGGGGKGGGVHERRGSKYPCWRRVGDVRGERSTERGQSFTIKYVLSQHKIISSRQFFPGATRLYKF